MPFIYLLSLLAIAFLGSISAAEDEHESRNDTRCYSCNHLAASKLELSAAFGDYIGVHGGYYEYGLFLMSNRFQEQNYFFDARAFQLRNKDWAGSLGVGIRKICHWQVWGANLYYDYRSTKLTQSPCRRGSERKHCGFNRIGIGFEMLSPCFDSRFNIYIPIGSSTRNTSTRINYLAGYHAEFKSHAHIAYGADLEIGKRFQITDYTYMYAAFGGYYYKNKHLKHIVGPALRLEYAFREFLKLQFRYSYDDTFKSGFQGEILLSIPLEDFSNWWCSWIDCYNPLTQPVRRNYVPFVKKRNCWDWNW